MAAADSRSASAPQSPAAAAIGRPTTRRPGGSQRFHRNRASRSTVTSPRRSISASDKVLVMCPSSSKAMRTGWRTNQRAAKARQQRTASKADASNTRRGHRASASEAAGEGRSDGGAAACQLLSGGVIAPAMYHDRMDSPR